MNVESALASDAPLDGHDVPSARDWIRARIVSGDFAPNQRLIETELCKDFGASRLLIRGALQDLANDGLVEIQKNRGARVRAISVEEAIEIVEVRMALECLSASRAARRATDDDKVELGDIAVQMRKAVENAEVLTYAGLNGRLHEAIQRISNNQTCAKTLDRLNGQIVRHQFALSLRPGRPAVSLVQHEDIVNAIIENDGSAAETAMRVHLGSVVDELSKMA